jgi:transposase-like protein
MTPDTLQTTTAAIVSPPARVATLGSLLATRDRQIAAFDDRYGRDAHARLLSRLARPCVSFAAIAHEFGVSRERVRQWRLQWAPETPTGRDRQRRCVATRRRRHLLEDPSFRSFYQQVRTQVPAQRFSLVPSQSGFRTRVVRIDDQVAVLTTGRRVTRSSSGRWPTYAVPPVPRQATFVYVQLGEGDYLFVPARVLPRRGTTFVDTPRSKYQRFRRTFAAIDARAAG